MHETMIVIGEWVIAVLVLIGALLSALSTFGLIRLPDVYLRSHAVTKSATLGILCILLSAFIYFMNYTDLTSAGTKLLLGVLFVFITAPVAGHLIGRASYRSGVRLWEGSVQDDLKKALKQPVRERDDG
ncbi:monovalent cation/H(+) antiporter subunit G [Paenibacillus tarimensis]